MSFIKNLLIYFFPKRNNKKSIFRGKKLIISVGEKSADDEDGDCRSNYFVIEGKVRERTINRTNLRSKDGLDFSSFKLVELTSLSRISKIAYFSHKGSSTIKSKRYIIQLFKNYQKGGGTIKL